MAARVRIAWLATLLCVGVWASGGCASAGRSGPRADRSVITRQQIFEYQFVTAFDAVQALRSNWLSDRGTNSLNTPTEVQVYLDGSRMGGVSSLRSIPTTTVQSIRYIDGNQATARWGLDHGRGVIFVSTHEVSMVDAFLVPPERRDEPPPREPAAARAAPAAVPEATNDPSFDWFEYTGRDSALEPSGPDAARYRNPILAGFYPDPSIARHGDDYYLVTSSFAYFPGIPIFHSRDLVQWTQIGHVLDRPSQLRLDTAGVSRGIFAPTLRVHDGTFHLITTAVDIGGNFLVTATNPAGPWSDPVPLGFDGIDPDLFFDDDGRVWIMNNGPPDEPPRYDGHRAIWLQEYDPRTQRMIGPRTVVVNGGVDISKRPIWIEAPHVFKVNGWYYLLCAEGGTAEQHSAVIFRSRAIGGPYVPYAGNPILTQRHLDPARRHPVTSTGHADFVQTPAGDWWAVFLGTRPYQGDFYNTGRETFLLPVRWRDGWPVILDDTATVPHAPPRPALAAQPAAAIPTQGNFTYRDEFADSALRHDWQFLRTPTEQWYSLTSPAGSLTLRARAASITEPAQPSFVARRQQHMTSSASTAMRYRPEHEGDRAGLVVFQNERFHYLLSVAMVNGRRMVQLEQAVGDLAAGRSVVASVPLAATASTLIHLRVDARGDRYEFSYALSPEAWVRVGDALDGTVLSTRRAGGFVGTMLGLYAYTPPR